MFHFERILVFVSIFQAFTSFVVFLPVPCLDLCFPCDYLHVFYLCPAFCPVGPSVLSFSLNSGILDFGLILEIRFLHLPSWICVADLDSIPGFDSLN